MRNNYIINMAKELLEIYEDLEWRVKNTQGKNFNSDDFRLETFEQLWGSTALGFMGCGGCAMTYANTYVFIPREPYTVGDKTISRPKQAMVYFGSKYAYNADMTDAFYKDLKKKSMANVAAASIEYRDFKKEDNKNE